MVDISAHQEWLMTQTAVATQQQVSVENSRKGGSGLFAISRLAKNKKILIVHRSLWSSFSAESAMKWIQQASPSLFKSTVMASMKLFPRSEKAGSTLVLSSSLAILLALAKQDYDQHLQQKLEQRPPLLQHPYLRYLCAEKNGTHPLTMAQEEIDHHLCGSAAYKAIMTRKKIYSFIAQSLAENCPHLKPTDLLSLNHDYRHQYFLWGMSIVLSRAVSGGPDQMPLTLVPVLDIANHSCHPNAAIRFDASSGSFSLVTLRDVEAGEELEISYGPGRDSSSFLSVYGFFDPEQTTNDVLSLSLSYELPTSPLDQGDQISTAHSWSSSSSSSYLSYRKELHQKLGISESPPSTGDRATAAACFAARAHIPMAFLLTLNLEDLKKMSERVNPTARSSFSSSSVSEILNSYSPDDDEEHFLKAVRETLGPVLLIPARAMVLTAQRDGVMNLDYDRAITNSLARSDEEKAVQVVLRAVDDAIAPLLREPNHLNFQKSAEEKLRQLVAASSATARGEKALWHQNCALVAARELDALIRLRACCIAYLATLQRSAQKRTV